MLKTTLIIDDQKDQAEGLARALTSAFNRPDCYFESYHEERDIVHAIDNRFFYLAIVDIRMDSYSINGIQVVKRIIENNPLAKVIIISAFKAEYFLDIKDLMTTGKVVDVLDKERFDTWIPKLKLIIEEYYNKLEDEIPTLNQYLLDQYVDAKNEENSYLKGTKFENVVFNLFGSLGLNKIERRVIDKSQNEVDLLIRNDIDDAFLSKFGKYILVECKNWTNAVDKNEFIIFNTKLKNTYGLAELGVLATTSNITKTAYIEAARDSGGNFKVIFLDGTLIERLILSSDRLEEFKKIIDRQVKDN